MTIKERLIAWIKRNVIDEYPYDDEGHSISRYSDADILEGVPQ